MASGLLGEAYPATEQVALADMHPGDPVLPGQQSAHSRALSASAPVLRATPKTFSRRAIMALHRPPAPHTRAAVRVERRIKKFLFRYCHQPAPRTARQTRQSALLGSFHPAPTIARPMNATARAGSVRAEAAARQMKRRYRFSTFQ
jgi:hypothetical protein